MWRRIGIDAYRGRSESAGFGGSDYLAAEVKESRESICLDERLVF